MYIVGAFGYFEVTHDITKYCKAKVFSQIGKRTPIAVRFSTVGKLLIVNVYTCCKTVHMAISYLPWWPTNPALAFTPSPTFFLTR